ncbi:hypothetical protein ENSA5_61440 [Enhygromyxa salina]|uniref:Uncharacterized protein n=1 Tax=Enhygromyxa salina TaxID=215803 RepID=A0A2S9XD73_9BACT|nr:hypothetical protein [Enhygromyxa salina]PRP90824.1 hypothetical protein ENSA5_61440 [Enhygromyxa salina]
MSGSSDKNDGVAEPAEGDAPAERPRPTSARVSSSRPRPTLESMRPRGGTIVALAVAGAAVTLAWADPFAKPDDGLELVNNRSGGRRVFPTLVDADPNKATIELQATDGPVVRVVPAPGGGHQLMHGDVLLGPVTDEDFEGLWSSLRLATAQRSAGRRDRVGHDGVIRISLPDETLTLSLGGAVPGGGVYGAFEADGDTWVVETEMLMLVQQPPRSWLAKRLLPIDVDRVTGLGWGDELILTRAADGFWRVRSGGTPALLSSVAVEHRVGRLMRAQLDPFVEREAVASESLRPWLVFTTDDGSSRALLVGGECPGHPRKQLVDRGPGLLGCVPTELLERWPLLEPDAGMLESRLVPHDYGRIVGIDLEQPSARRLIRRGGQWFYTGEGEAEVEPVAEAEVRRWYQALGRLEVALLTVDSATPEGGGQPEGQGEGEGATELALDGLSFEPDWTLVVHADTGEQLRVTCQLGADPVLCVRDEGAVLRVLGEPPRNLAFEAETFAERRLTQVGPGEVRELEILPPVDVDSSTVRQSVHADMGAWQLDAPAHVDDNGAIDEVRLENLLWALRSLRAEAWVDPPSTAPLRRLVAEVVPERGARYTLEVTVFPDCIVEVEGQRPAAVAEAQCAALAEDLLFDDPLRFWLERSRGVEIADAGGDTSVFLRRRDQQFVTDDNLPLDDDALAARLQGWIDWRSGGVRAGEAPGDFEWTLDVRRDFGPAAQVEIGPGWVRLRGANWYYVEREPGDDPVKAGLEPSDDFDPGAIDLDPQPEL